MSKGEKLFWIVIALFFMTYLYISFVASSHKREDSNKSSTKILVSKEYIIRYFPTQLTKQNIDKYQSNINLDLNSKIDGLNKIVDTQIDSLFVSIDARVDTFLDFHYSVKGEYIELGAMFTNNLKDKVSSMIFGSSFSTDLQHSVSVIFDEYNISLADHISLLEELGLEGVDSKLNTDSIDTMKSNIDGFKVSLGAKGAFVSYYLGAGVVTSISAKIALKATAKITAKGGIKATSKVAAASTGAASGALCGPLFWICSPVLATGAWLATDAIVVTGDELLHRKAFKKEIQQTINHSKNSIKSDLKNSIYKRLKELSVKVQDNIKNTLVLKKERVKIIDKIMGGFATKKDAIKSTKSQ